MIQSPAAQSDTYLLQRINGATPEQLCILLLEGAQRFLRQAIQSTADRNVADKARYVNRVSAIIEELTVQLNMDEGSELVVNLTRIYDWWMHQLFEGSLHNRPETFEMIYAQMGSIRETWEELAARGSVSAARAQQPLSPQSGGLGTEFIG